MDHAAFRELAAGAVLDDLDPDEQLRFAAHRAGCRACGGLVEDLLDATADLAALVPSRPVPAALHGSVLAAVAAGSAGRPGAPRPADRSMPTFRSRLAAVPDRITAAGRSARRIRPWAAHRLLDLGAAGLVAVLATVAVGLSVQLSDSRSAVASARTQLAAQTGAMAVAADGGHHDVALKPEVLAPGASATVMFIPGTTASYVTASGLPATPAGKVYELWVADTSGVHGLGTYTYDGRGLFVAPLGVDLASARAAMITLEPAGGARGAPGPQVVFGTF